MRRKVLLSVVFLVFVLLIMLFSVLKANGYIDYLNQGSAYFINNEEYTHSTSLIKEEYTMNLNMTNLDMYKDQYVIENDLFNIRMNTVEIDEAYNVILYFYLESNYNFNGGKIVYIGDVNNISFNNNKDFHLTTNIEGIAISTKITGEGPFLNSGYGAAVYLTFDEKVDFSQYDELTFSFHNLMINHYVRNK